MDPIDFNYTRVVFNINDPQNIVLTTGEHSESTFEGINVKYKGRTCDVLEISTYRKQDFALLPTNLILSN